MEKFIESLEVSFLLSVTLYQIWIKVMKKEMTVEEARSMILNTNGVVKI